jgi:hypothetical protein
MKMLVKNEIEESVRQLATTWSAIVEDRKSGEVIDVPGLNIRWADTRFAFFNTITLNEAGLSSDVLSRRLASAASYMAEQGEQGFLWLFQDLLSEEANGKLEELIDEAGFTLAMSGYGMAGQFLPIPEPYHKDLSFVRVKTEAQLTAYAEINAQAYGMPIDAVLDGMRPSSLWTDRAYSILGLEDGRPVSAASVIENEGSLFLALVATLPSDQFRGYGEATCRKALYEGWKATGLTRSVLHATIPGAPVYERIGYHKTSSIGFYALKG